MGRSLSELTSEAASFEPRSYLACVGAGRAYVAEVQMLSEELSMLPIRSKDPETPGPPKRQGQGQPARAVEIRERMEELLNLMKEYEGQFRIEATKSEGEWRRWCNDHPARNENEPGYKRDLDVANGHCNADDLLDEIEQYVVAWNDEILVDGMFEKLKVSPPDVKAIGRIVIGLYEGGMSIPHWRSVMSATLAAERTSSSLASSESQSVDSSGGSPKKSTHTTTRQRRSPAGQSSDESLSGLI